MPRHHDQRRTTFAGSPVASPGGPAPASRSAARVATAALRLIVAPFAAIAAAAAGLVFAVLLPICGIATIAEAIAKAAGRFVRDTFVHAPHPPVHRT